MSKISVIVPCYNAATYIEKMIVALAEQEFRDFDVFFVDDCSMDETSRVVEQCIQKYGIAGTIIRNVHNLGPSLSRKQGIDYSNAEYVAFCDCDDWYDKDFLSKMYDATEREKHDIVFCNYRLVYSTGRTLNKDVIGDVSRYHNSKQVMTIGIDGVWGGLFRRTLFEGLHFPNIRNGEDMALIPVLISRAHSFGYVRECIYNYFQREGSLSSTRTTEVVQSLQESFAYVLESVDMEYADEVEYLGIRNLVYGALLNLFQQGYRVQEANQILNSFDEKFPNWIQNPYRKELPYYRRVFVTCAKKRVYVGIKVLAALHHILTK